MKWNKLSDVNPNQIYGKRCVVFRIKRKKFAVSRLEWFKAHSDDKAACLDQDKWCWVTEYSSLHDIDSEDMFFLLPTLEINSKEIYE